MPTPSLISSTNIGQASYNDGDSVNFDFSALSPADGDTVVIFAVLRSQGGAPCSLVPPAGYSVIDSVATSGSGALYVVSHVWHTGDTTNPAFTMHGSSVGNAAARFAVLLRPSAGSVAVAVNGSPTHSIATATSIASSSLTPTSPSDLYFVLYAADSTHDGPWSGPPTLTSLFSMGNSPSEIDAVLATGTFSAATGTYTASLGASLPMRQISVLFGVPSGGGGSGGGSSGIMILT